MNLFLTVAFLGSMIFAGVKVIPPYFANYQMQDSMETEARFAVSNRKAEQDIRDDMARKAKELGIPAKPDSLKVAYDGSAVQISMDYSIPVDLVVYQFTLQFHPHADNRSI